MPTNVSNGPLALVPAVLILLLLILAAPPLLADTSAVDCANAIIKAASDKGLCKPYVIPADNPPRRRRRTLETIADRVNAVRRQTVAGQTSLPDLSIAEAFQLCIPLVSVSPRANPYHEQLTGIPIGQVVGRVGSGIAIPLDNAIHCGAGSQACPWTQMKELSLTTGMQLGVTNGNVNTVTKTNTTNWSTGNTDTHVQAITNILEHSISKANTTETNGSDADDQGDTLTKTHENSTTSVLTKTLD
ncbi:hypothetical protein HK101_007587, partial [Irineochytrium annulatum]